MQIIDAHAHIYSKPTLRQSEEEVLLSMKRYGIAFSLISNCDAAEYASGVSPKAKNTTTLKCLNQVLVFVRRNPSKLGAAVWIRPVKENGPSEELKECVRKNRQFIYALKFHPYCEQTPISSPLCEPWLRWAEEEDFPIIVHTAEDEWSDISHLVEAAKKHPSLRFVAAHLQLCSDNSKGIAALYSAPNIYGDTAWVPMKVAAKILRQIGSDRVMFGTDNPIDGADTLSNPMYQDYFANRSRLSKALYENLMENNAISFFRLRLTPSDPNIKINAGAKLEPSPRR